MYGLSRRADMFVGISTSTHPSANPFLKEANM